MGLKKRFMDKIFPIKDINFWQFYRILEAFNFNKIAMAIIDATLSSDGTLEKLTVDLKKHTPIHVMFQMVGKNHSPSDGNIWKMTKTGGSTNVPVPIKDYFRSLEYNGISDKDKVILTEFPF